MFEFFYELCWLARISVDIKMYADGLFIQFVGSNIQVKCKVEEHHILFLFQREHNKF